jgi:glycosyltransferase involved in cell wall biosynthesis
MKVAIVQSEARFIGGVERVTEDLLRYHGWHGDDLYAIFLRSGVFVDRVRQFFPPEKMLVLEAGRFRQIGTTVKTIYRMTRQLKRWGIQTTLSQGFHAQCYGGPAARLAGARNVFWCHALLRPDREAKDFVVRTARRMPASAVLGFPKSNLPNLSRAFPSIPVRLVYPSECLQEFAQATGVEVRRELGIAACAPLVAMIGRVQPWKGQHVFVKAAATVAQHVPDARFVIVGGASGAEDEQYLESLRTTSAKLGIADRVMFTGERNDVANFIAAADVIVHASVDPEPFGLVLIEAMAAGKPVIASNGGGPAEIVLDGETGFLTDPGDAQALAERTITLLRDPELRARMGAAASARVEHEFSFEQMIERLEQVFAATQ